MTSSAGPIQFSIFPEPWFEDMFFICLLEFAPHPPIPFSSIFDYILLIFLNKMFRLENRKTNIIFLVANHLGLH